jgi:hypothetical protein
MKIFSPMVVGQGGLPPHRPGINHAIKLEKDEFRKEKDVPWGPLYSITKEKLLMLRKTLTNHFDKGWIVTASVTHAAVPHYQSFRKRETLSFYTFEHIR